LHALLKPVIADCVFSRDMQGFKYICLQPKKVDIKVLYGKNNTAFSRKTIFN